MSYKDARQILSAVFDSENSALRANLKTEGELLNMVLDQTGEKPALRIRLAGSQPAVSIIDGEAAVYADLPNPAEHISEIYIVTTPSGIPLVNRKQAGMYRSDGLSWTLLDTDLQADKVYYSGSISAGNVQDALETLKLVSDVNSSSVAAHSSNASNPHCVTKTQIGLGNVDNTADTAKPVSTAVQSALNTKMTASAHTGAFGNLDSPFLHLPLKKNLLTAQGQSVCTFTRASAATYIDRYGVLKSVSADTPRFTAEGLLIEGASTNLLTYSEQFDNGAWVKTNASVTPNSTVDPYGTNLADKLVEDTSNGVHIIDRNISVVSGSTYSFSIFAKAGERNKIRLSAASLGARIDADLSNGTLSGGAGAGYVSSSISALGNGWYRISLTYTETTTGSRSQACYLISGSSTSYTGDGTSGLYIFGAQLEAMPFASSYMPTTSAAAARAYNNLSLPQAENMPWYTKNFTILIDIATYGLMSTQYIIGDANLTSGIKLYIDETGDIKFFLSGVTIGASMAANTSNTHRVCIMKTAMTIHIYINGELRNSNALPSIPANQTNLYVGSINGTSGHCYARISNLRIYDRALTAEEVRLA